MKVVYLNILKRPSGKISMTVHDNVIAAETAENLRIKAIKGSENNDPAHFAARIRVDVETACIEGRYDF